MIVYTVNYSYDYTSAASLLSIHKTTKGARNTLAKEIRKQRKEYANTSVRNWEIENWYIKIMEIQE